MVTVHRQCALPLVQNDVGIVAQHPEPADRTPLFLEPIGHSFKLRSFYSLASCKRKKLKS